MELALLFHHRDQYTESRWVNLGREITPPLPTVISSPRIAGHRYTDGMKIIRQSQQIRSKSRVEEHGEVFTSPREVNAMLNLVKDEAERIDSRFLEPACGNGNFLVEVLRRKLAVINKNYGNNQLDFERYTFIAVASLYGIDLLEDNIYECRKRLFQEVERKYKRKFKQSIVHCFLDSIQYVLSCNIVCGDALTMTKGPEYYIVFPEWSLVTGSKVKRRDFEFHTLLEVTVSEPTFDMVNNLTQDNNGKIVPRPIKDYPIIDFRRVTRYE